MGARLVSGRWFNAGDIEGRQRVIVIDERLARKFWPKGDAVGKRMFQPESTDDVFKPPPEDQMLHVIGVIGEMRLRAMVDAAGAERPGAYYFPLRQRPERSMGLAVRAAAEPAALTGQLRQVVGQVDRELPLYNIRSMRERTDEALVDRRTPALLAGGFAIVALLLSGVGIYGVLAYQVSQRRREIGIRMALGAGAPRIFSLVMGEGATIVGLGALFGPGRRVRAAADARIGALRRRRHGHDGSRRGRRRARGSGDAGLHHPGPPGCAYRSDDRANGITVQRLTRSRAAPRSRVVVPRGGECGREWRHQWQRR